MPASDPDRSAHGERGVRIGEFALIDRILARLGNVAARDILVPPGDDAAVWVPAGAAVVVTTDAVVEGSHWRPDTMGMWDVGWRAIASNASDIAAMGATPEQAFVTLVLAPTLPLEGVDALVDGMAECCRAHGLHVAGGDIVTGTETAVAVTIVGSAPVVEGRARVLRRDAARPGFAVAVSGTPGASGAGLAIVNAGRAAEPAAAPLLAAHRHPVGRIALGLAAVQAGVTCAIDISDGLLQDAGHIAERSRAGIELDLAALPLHPAAVALLGREAAIDLALGGGEDYELVLAGPEAALRALGTAALPVTVIGHVVEAHPGEAWAIAPDGARYAPPSAGWDPLRATPARAPRSTRTARP